MYLQTYLQYYRLYSTVLLYMCSKQEHKADHGHKKGHAPRAQEGRSFTGISRPRTEVLRTRAYFSAANTLLRSRASRGHLNLFKIKDGKSTVVRGWWSSFLLYLYSTVLQYRNFLKILSDDSAHALSSGLTSKMPRRRTLLRLTAKETAHVNAIS